MDFKDRCRVAEKCLPDAPYKEQLIALHDEMLSAINPAGAPSALNGGLAVNIEQALEWADTWEKVPSEIPSGDEQALIVLAHAVRKQRECLLWIQERHHGGLMRAKIDEALTANAKVTGSPDLSASPCGLTGYAGDNNGEQK